MKTTTLIMTLALAAGLAAAGTAQAAGKIYVGGKLGIVDADISGFDPAVNIGVYGGYNLLGKNSHFAADLKGGTLAVEGDVSLSILKGDAGVFGDWDMTSIAVYAAYRHPLTDYFYLKGKLGLVRYEIDVDGIPSGLVAGRLGTETALAAGFGAGWKVGPGSLEAEITTYEGDVMILSAGFHMNF